MVPTPEGGRVFRQELRPGLADCSPSGRIRLDALARWLQDLAYADVTEAGVADRAVWVLRRARMRVKRFPRFGEQFNLGTFCSGLGRMWAERRSTIARAGETSDPDVEAVSLWVHLDPVARRPTPLTPDEIAVYGDAAARRKVTARLRHPAPDGQAVNGFAWTFRGTECDLAGHINNAAYWQPLEEELLAGAEPERIDVEMEFRTPAQPGQKLVLRHGDHRWIVGEDGETHASMRLAFVAG
jgi:acyl-ACP thioesterase